MVDGVEASGCGRGAAGLVDPVLHPGGLSVRHFVLEHTRVDANLHGAIVVHHRLKLPVILACALLVRHPRRVGEHGVEKHVCLREVARRRRAVRPVCLKTKLHHNGRAHRCQAV